MKPFRHLLNPLRRFWGQSIRRQLAWSFSIASLLTILGAGFVLLSVQRDFLYSQGTKNAIDLAQTLSFSSVSWVLANDVVGLQEVLKGTSETTDLKFAVVLSPYGEVLASTNRDYIGRYFGDPVSQGVLTLPAEPQILLDEANLIDVAVPIKAGNFFIGWVRVELTRDTANKELQGIAAAGLGLALFMVLTIVIIATALARHLTRGLAHLVNVAIDAEHGRAFQREDVARKDEIGMLARHLYQMLDAIEAEKKAKSESEARFRRLIQVAPIPIAYIAKGGIIQDFNDRFARIFGYTHDDIPTLEEWRQLAYPDANYREWVINTWNAALQKAAETKQDIQPNEYRISCKNGDVRIMDIAGVILGEDLLEIFIDITERKRNEEELRRYKDHLEDEVQQRTVDLVLARNAAEAANQAKSVFLANMSHELRTPMNAILGFSRVMHKDSSLTEDQRQNLDIINRSGNHLLSLINDVLEMAKIEAGRVQLENQPFDLGAMIRDVTEMLDVRAREKGLRLLIDQSSKFPRYINGDEARLRQVLINLTGNAIKFTEQGGVTLRLDTRQNDDSHLLIEVEDSGPGIATADQQRIFEPFEQLTDQGKNKGTGLGLSITRQFVELMGGSIRLNSTLGEGSVFVIDLPLKEVQEGQQISLSQDIETRDVVGLEPGQAEYRILIVEDQLENQLLLSKIMENIGLQYKVAENGEKGVQLFKSWRPHLIWMDRRMPVMDGLQAARTIRNLPGGADVKIVAVTASVFVEQRAELLEAGMDDFVRKPYRFSEIYDCLAKQLGLKFIYEGTTTPTEDVMLTPEMLLPLPDELRDELKAALESLESDRIGSAIRQVESYDQILWKTLSHLTENFAYPTILNALEAWTRSQ